ncbi:MAG: Ig-like domain repeat protein [Clostridia bacterium]|nr:Ig-like domain repeat protein [Clostridia bacterium]
MKYNRLVVLGLVLIVLFLSIGVTTANENTTLEGVESNVEDTLMSYDENLGEYGDYGENYNARIIANNVTVEYDDEYELSIYIVDNNNNPIEMAEPYFEDYLNSWYDSNGYYYFYPSNYDVGTHNVTFTLDDGLYKAEPVSINMKIVKSVFYGEITCKSYWGTTKSTLTMKATVYNPYGSFYEEGYVTFKVNGKSYKVKTKGGVATKTIKIKKSGTYTYTAKFINNNYKSSGVTGKAKLYVKKYKKYYTFTAKDYDKHKTTGKLIYKLPYKYYLKLLTAKSKGKTCYLNFKSKVKVYGNKWYKTRCGFDLNKKGKLTFTYEVDTYSHPVFAYKVYNL